MGGLVNLSIDVEALEVLADGAAVAGVVVDGAWSSLRKRSDERGGVDILNKVSAQPTKTQVLIS